MRIAKQFPRIFSAVLLSFFPIEIAARGAPPDPASMAKADVYKRQKYSFAVTLPQQLHVDLLFLQIHVLLIADLPHENYLYVNLGFFPVSYTHLIVPWEPESFFPW